MLTERPKEGSSNDHSRHPVALRLAGNGLSHRRTCLSSSFDEPCSLCKVTGFQTSREQVAVLIGAPRGLSSNVLAVVDFRVMSRHGVQHNVPIVLSSAKACVPCVTWCRPVMLFRDGSSFS